MINGGIDQQVQQKVDAYRSKPQMLQQRYAQNKELIDLLALQKLKSEKDAVARDMQMQMQQNPQTIKDQLETEMVQRTKQDMMSKVGQVKGVLDKRQTDQMKRAKQMGIATAPTPNMARMAGGGIVGFAGPQGSQVQGELTEKELKVLGYSKADFEALPDNIKAQILQKISKQREYLSEQVEDTPSNIPLLSSRKTLEAEMERRKKVGDTFVPDARTDYSLEETIAPRDVDDLLSQPQTQTQPQPQTRPPIPTEDETDYLDDGMAPAPVTEEPSGIAAVPGITATKVDVPTAQANRNLQAYKPDMSGDTAGAGLEDLFRGMTQTDTTKAAEEEYKRSLGKIGYSDKEKALRQRRIDELEAIRAKRMDPEALRGEELSSFLRGMAGRSTTGMALAGGSAGAARARKAAQQAETGLLGDVMGVETDLMKELAAQREKSYGFGQEAMKQGREDIRTGATGLGNLSVQARSEAQAYADQLQKADIADLKADDRQRKMELDAAMSNADREMEAQIKTTEGVLAQERNRIQAEANQIRSQTDAQRVLSQVQKNIQDTVEAYRESYAERIDKLRIMPPAGMSEDQVETLIENLRQQEAKVIQASVENMKQLEAALTARAGGVDMSQFGQLIQ
jgi:hypothetical protein